MQDGQRLTAKSPCTMTRGMGEYIIGYRCIMCGRVTLNLIVIGITACFLYEQGILLTLLLIAVQLYEWGPEIIRGWKLQCPHEIV